jgi:glutathionylspermidine synthase
MERIEVNPRKDSAKKLESIGLSYHAWDDFWNESACYKFTLDEINELEEATNELHEMCLAAVKHIILNNRFTEMSIPEEFWAAIIESFDKDDLTLYGRFDLAYDGKSPPKMLEYNADTPTSLLESAVAQWYWMEEVFPNDDQFNSIHEKLVDRWKKLPALTRKIHFASLRDNEEDWVCVHYLMDTAIQAGFQVEHIYVEDIGWDSANNEFLDMNNEPIEVMFKLYPWEWMMREDFGKNVLVSNTIFVEPLWKCLLSNKAILPILWELFPNHPYLLPAYFTPGQLKKYAKKPIFSREGANIELVENGLIIAHDEGPYGQEGHIYQALHTLPDFGDKFAVIGSWIVGDESAGICLREDTLKITTNMSRFVPHYFVEP